MRLILAITAAGLTAALSAGCGKLEKKDAKTTAAPVSSGDATTSDVSSLEVLAPGELATKIYSAFGPSMTTVTQNGKSVDYLAANANNFVGSISSDPNNKYAQSFSVGYFLALAGLSEVVGQNYAVALYSNQATNDCRTQTGAENLLRGVAPTISTSDLAEMSGDLMAACQSDPATAASAVVQSYSTALKSTM